MGTRSDIIVQRRDGKWARIYCHWNGYLEHNGRILFEHYQGQEIAEKLVALGDLSLLGEEIGEKHDFDWQMKLKPEDAEYERLRRMCCAYKRDRNGKGTNAKVGSTLAQVWPGEDAGTEFTYVFARDDEHPDGRWMVGDPDEGTQTLIDLGDALAGKKTLCPSVKAFGVNFVIGQHLPSKPGKPHGWTR